MRLIARSNEMRSHEDLLVDQLDLAEDDEVSMKGISDRRDVAERPRRPQDGRVANDCQLRLRRESEHGRVGQRL